MQTLVSIFLFFALAFGMVQPARADDLTVFAAASLRNALAEAAASFTAETGTNVTVSAAGSSTLARQIEMGAPADVFVSANPGWMDRLEERGRLVAGTRRDLLGNRLVLIGNGASPSSLGPDLDLAAALGSDGRLAMALVDAVPAGIYGKAALTRLGQWENVSARVAQTDNVRAALALVAVGAAPLGIVYATDAQAEPRVSVLYRFAEDMHPPIIYPAAAIAGANEDRARAFLDHLHGDAARAVFLEHGFAPLTDTPDG
ncbi:molybdate ABC transporter substrate-binding protein [Lutimaribacter marinistellae]|uniref:Molybdate ABC transporter substrate-binding protein n=1 Tax=Lutimaribacter marinistellae TaxID=1820329 RepID=A0ABV7TGQ6_9RHOB